MSFACRINVLKPKLNSHVQTSAVRYVLYLKLKKNWRRETQLSV